jgi:hypothetical protein
MKWGTLYDFVALFIAFTVRLLKGFNLQDICAKTNCWLKTKWYRVRLGISTAVLLMIQVFWDVSVVQ